MIRTGFLLFLLIDTRTLYERHMQACRDMCAPSGVRTFEEGGCGDGPHCVCEGTGPMAVEVVP